ncbi:MAG: bifunctional UDP-N-acetylglucosamine diphosphorylase/glucosamine-1-phosphate N-acetyltransferase GlmU [Deltaproteobacteria bacterium]|nr:bifunctional UDP-N-acetylglucosamine diphosphorylase/glucosamine-1-phosphate N-acetyltransferase GlmU [Deltaproteobacteria bacterium]
MSKQTAIVLAAGQGTRMKSALAKVLHPVCGRPMLDHVLEAALTAGCDDAVVVVGHQREAVTAHLKASFGDRVRVAVQDEQRGTGHAVQCALTALDADCRVVLVLCGDTPLVRADDLRAVLAARKEEDAPLAMLTCRVPDPTGYGRILRDEGQVVAIREHRDASADERRLDEINPGMYAVRLDFARVALAALEPNNQQGELYLTDIVTAASRISAVRDVPAPHQTLVGVNDRAQLAAAEDAMHHRIADDWRRRGVTVRTGARIDARVTIEVDAVIESLVVLRGATHVSRGAHVDVGCVLDDVVVGPGAKLLPYSVCTRSSIGEDARVGPFSHLRQDSDVGPEAHVGNFVETKKTVLHRGAKANHLAYLGDGEIGEGANVGAGTIFCNYDGFQKHKTTIGARAFIGSDSQLVAPVTIGEGAYVATGTTVTKDVPPDALALGRTPQENKEGYAAKLRGRLAARSRRSSDRG